MGKSGAVVCGAMAKKLVNVDEKIKDIDVIDVLTVIGNLYAVKIDCGEVFAALYTDTGDFLCSDGSTYY